MQHGYTTRPLSSARCVQHKAGDAYSFMIRSLSHSEGVIKHTADVAIALW